MTTAGFITAAVVTVIGGAGGAALFQWLSKIRDQRLAEKKDEREASQDSVAIVNSWREQAKSSAEDAAEARKDARAARDEMASMRADIEALLDRVTHLERVEDDMIRLAGFVVVVKAGVQSGQIPPWPSEPPTVAALMSQVRKQESE